MKPERPSSADLDVRMRNARDIDEYLAENQEHMLNQSLKEHLTGLLIEKNISIAKVAEAGQLDRVYIYQIFDGKKRPSRDKLIAIAFGFGLDEEETQKLLKVSRNKELYVRDRRDAVILFAIQRGKTLMDTNDMIHDHGMNTLGNME